MKKALLVIILAFLAAVPSIAGTDDEIVVITARPPADRVTAKTLERIYLKRKILWSDGQRIVPVNLPANHPLRAAFTKRILKRSHGALVEYWNERHFNGVHPPVVVESEEAVKRFVREVDGAVGYISRSSLEPGIEVIFTIPRE